MSSISNLWASPRSSSATDLAMVSGLSIPGESFGDRTIEPDKCHIDLYVESLRLEEARKFATTFHGVVYSFQTFAREGDTRANLAAISKPEKLAKLDGKSLRKVTTISKQLAGLGLHEMLD